ncbi:MAG TPA: AmmeMemoRadiSam system protein B [Candidatus Cloacimonetes bacterium]|nr:AmmeMemoRadiSam system protein B [Candidatus Cloacimonadota bacterium]HEX37506.1 AmmeMemoRadiSam system protein B [Candidatus Cloacimonadota bacterium]
MIEKIGIFLFLMLLSTNLWSETLEPSLAGSWYPGSKKELRDMLTQFFNNVELGKNKDIVPFGLISPHAGLVYSGPIAAYGYSLLKNGDFDTIIIIATSHRYNLGKISIFSGDKVKSPLGTSEVDNELAQQLIRQHSKFESIPQVITNGENSFETQLPFVQYQLPDVKILPIMTATNDLSLLDDLADALVATIAESDKKIALVASSDMAHFHPYEQTVEMDHHTIDLILSMDLDALKTDVMKGKCEICGFHAIYPFMKVMQHFGANKPVMLAYQNSADITGDKHSSHIVGYSSIVFPEPDTGIQRNDENASSDEELYSHEEKKYLLDLARQSIIYFLKNGKKLQPEEPGNKKLLEERAVFVTLNKDGSLRGCIGHMHAQMPLYEAVAQMAVSAAFEDPRFSKVKENELKDITIEISVLSPMQKIDDWKKIRMGIDGVWIKKGWRSGVFLPQVATETGWDRVTFLENLCAHKAGLPANAYKESDTEIYIYQVEKFSEEEVD